jgi:hypothetical protein
MATRRGVKARGARRKPARRIAAPAAPIHPRVTMLLRDAAAELHVSTRTLRDRLRDEPCLVPFGRKLLLDRELFAAWAKRQGFESASRLLEHG